MEEKNTFSQVPSWLGLCSTNPLLLRGAASSGVTHLVLLCLAKMVLSSLINTGGRHTWAVFLHQSGHWPCFKSILHFQLDYLN